MSHLSGVQRQIMLEIYEDDEADPQKGTHISVLANRLREWNPALTPDEVRYVSRITRVASSALSTETHGSILIR